MAQPKIRSASLFLGGRKMGTIEGIKYTYNSGDEPQFGDPGGVGFSDGAATTNLTATGIVPVAGMSVDIVTAMQNKSDFEVSLALINGKIHQITMRATKAEFTGSQKSGTLMGDFEWSGFEPKITG